MPQLSFHNSATDVRSGVQKSKLLKKYCSMGVFLIFFIFILLFLGKQPPYDLKLYSIIISILVGLFLALISFDYRYVTKGLHSKWKTITFQSDSIQIEYVNSANIPTCQIIREKIKKIKMNLSDKIENRNKLPVQNLNGSLYLGNNGFLNQSVHQKLDLTIKTNSKTYRISDIGQNCENGAKLQQIQVELYCFSFEFYHLLPKTNNLNIKAAYSNIYYSQIQNQDPLKIFQTSIEAGMEKYRWVLYLVKIISVIVVGGFIASSLLIPLLSGSDQINWTTFIGPGIVVFAFILLPLLKKMRNKN